MITLNPAWIMGIDDKWVPSTTARMEIWSFGTWTHFRHMREQRRCTSTATYISTARSQGLGRLSFTGVMTESGGDGNDDGGGQ